MKILVVIDSMELNGGSTMFLEMVRALRKYHSEHNIIPLVISKTGQYGRKNLISKDMMQSYECEVVPSIKYEQFKERKWIQDGIIIHHRLQCTRPLKVSSPYIVINHTVQSPHRMAGFKHANAIVSVCKHIKKTAIRHVNSYVILNGIENDFIDDVDSAKLPGDFITGRCHRLHACKFRKTSIGFLNDIPIRGHKHYILGPHAVKKSGCVQYMGPVFNRIKKISTIKAFDVYYYDTDIKEGASAAILEGLACGVPVLCRPLGGNKELVKDGVNGFYFSNYEEASSILKELSSDKQFLLRMKSQVKEDFKKRLHVRHMINQYVTLITKMSKA